MREKEKDSQSERFYVIYIMWHIIIKKNWMCLNVVQFGHQTFKLICLNMKL